MCWRLHVIVPCLVLVGAASCGSKKDRASGSDEAPRLIEEGKEALVAEMIRKAELPDEVERVWDGACEDVGVFTLAQGCLPMPHSILRAHAGRIYLVLGSKEAPTCDRRYGPQISRTQPIVAVKLPPGARRVRERPIGAQGSLYYPDGTSLATNAGPSRLELDPGRFDRQRPVTGTLSIDGVGAGRFAATLCPDDFAAVWDGPESKPATSLTVSVSGRPFPVATTVFRVHSYERYTIVSALLFDRTADCTTPAEQSVGAGVITLTGPEPFALVGSEQPAHANHASSEQRAMLSAYGWGSWDEMSTEPGGRVRARVHVESEPHVPVERSLSVSGPLEGTVCPRN